MIIESIPLTHKTADRIGAYYDAQNDGVMQIRAEEDGSRKIYIGVAANPLGICSFAPIDDGTFSKSEMAEASRIAGIAC